MVYSASERRFDLFALVVVTALTALPALLIYPFPGQDGHQHAFVAFALSRLDDARLGLGRYLRVNLPLSSQGYVFLVAGLDQLMPFDWAERLGLALTLAAFPLGGAFYARAMGTAYLPTAGLLALTAHGWVLVMGFFNFLLACALVPLVLSRAAAGNGESGGKGGGRQGIGRAVTLSLALLVLAWFHLAVALFAGVLLVAVVLGGSRGTRVRRLVQVLVCGLPAGAYAIWATQRHLETGVGSGMIASLAPVYESWPRRLVDLFGVGPGGICPVTGGVAVMLFVLVMVQAFRRSGHRCAPARSLVIAFGVFLVAYLVSPVQASRWAFLSPRILFAAMIALSLAGFEGNRRRWMRGAVFGLILVGLTGSNLALLRLHRRLEPLNEAVMGAPHREGRPLIPLDLSPSDQLRSMRYVEPTLHLGTRALIGSGGITPYLFATNRSVHAIAFRQDPEALVGPYPAAYIRRGWECRALSADVCLGHRLGLVDRLAYYGLFWGELLLFHSPELVSERLDRRGYESVFERGPVRLWVAHPAGLRVLFRLPIEPLPEDLVVHVGLFGSVGKAQGLRFPAGAVPSALEAATFSPLPAGPIDLVMFLDSDRDGDLDLGEWSRSPTDLFLSPDQVYEVELVVDGWP